MPEEPSGPYASPTTSSSPPQQVGNRTRGRSTTRSQRNRNRGGGDGVHRTRFEGKVDDLKRHTYDVGAGGRGTADMFSATTKEIVEYIARTVKGGGEFLTAMDPNDMGFTELTDPSLNPPADNASFAAKETWRSEMKRYLDKSSLREEATKQAIAIVLGQCSQTIRDRIKAARTYQHIISNSDLIRLLGLIRESLYTGSTTKKTTQSLQEAEESLVSFRQGDNMSNNTFLDKFKGLVERYEYHGGEPGMQQARINAQLEDIMADINNPTDVEVAEAKATAREEYLAVLFIRKSDPKRYGQLVLELENNHTRGADQYPTTMERAYDMLVNYKSMRNNNRFDRQDFGVAYYSDDNNNNVDTQHHNHAQEISTNDRSGDEYRGGRSGGRGRGRGRGRRNGRGHGNQHRSGTATRAFPNPELHMAEHDEEEEENNINSDNQQNNSHINTYSTYPSHTVTLLHVESYIQHHHIQPNRSLFLDSCSSTNLISTPSLLHDIHEVKTTLHVRCNAGVLSTNQMGYLGTYPEPVWYNPGGVANILSQNNVAQHFRLTMDTQVENSISLHRMNGSPLVFTPTHNGLYCYTLSNEETINGIWAMISTVKGNADKYTKRDYHRAIEARRFQNVIMRPGDRELMDTSIQHLKDCPITRQDIMAATDIFGPNLGSLKARQCTGPTLMSKLEQQEFQWRYFPFTVTSH